MPRSMTRSMPRSMPRHTCRSFFLALLCSLLLPAGAYCGLRPLPSQANLLLAPTSSVGGPANPGMHAQLGFASSRILQQFHLPSSPAELMQFVLEYTLKQKLGNTLPLALNASDALPFVENAQLPGGPFHGKPLNLTAQTVQTPLAPGDYTVPVTAFCTQYSVHRPGSGTAYKLAPVKGTQAEVVATLLWRGNFAGKRPQDLQATNWAIQAGIPYGSMPKPYQEMIDQLIPEYKSRLQGNMMDQIQSTYREVTGDPRKFVQLYIKEHYNVNISVMALPKIAVPAPPLEVVMAKMGAPGLLLLDAKKQSTILLTSYTTKELGEQTLFAGQGQQLPPEPASEGPWTVRVAGTAFLRFKIVGGNMQSNNLMEIRILPQVALGTSEPKLLEASYQSPSAKATALEPTSILSLLGVVTAADATQKLTATGLIGYSQGGGGAQALIPVLNAAPQGPVVKIAKLIYNDVTYPDAPETAKARKSSRAVKPARPELASGLCTFIGASITSPNAASPVDLSDFRWEQRVYTNGEGTRAGCTSASAKTESGGWSGGFVDPCDDPKEDSPPYYRPRSTEASWHSYLGFDYVFRDIPSRVLSTMPPDLFWHATTKLIYKGDETTPLATIDWGFAREGDRLRAEPMMLTLPGSNASALDASPVIAESDLLQAKYLCDVQKVERTTPKLDKNHALPPKPDGYLASEGYTFHPADSAH